MHTQYGDGKPLWLGLQDAVHKPVQKINCKRGVYCQNSYARIRFEKIKHKFQMAIATVWVEIKKYGGAFQVS